MLTIVNNYDECGYYTKCIEHNLEALRLFESTNNKSGISSAYNNIGGAYYRLSEYSKPIYNYNKSLAATAYEYYLCAFVIHKKLGIKREFGNDYGSIGELYFNIAKDSVAKICCITIISNQPSIPTSKSKYFLTKAVGLAKNAGNLLLMMYYNNILFETEELIGNYSAAFEFHKDYTLYKDSIFNDANRKNQVQWKMSGLQK